MLSFTARHNPSGVLTAPVSPATFIVPGLAISGGATLQGTDADGNPVVVADTPANRARYADQLASGAIVVVPAGGATPTSIVPRLPPSVTPTRPPPRVLPGGFGGGAVPFGTPVAPAPAAMSTTARLAWSAAALGGGYAAWRWLR